MELDAINAVEWSDNIPNKEGLYLFKKETIWKDKYIDNILDIVHVKNETVTYNNQTYSYLAADSDNWPTWYNLKELPFNGTWSKRITFE